MTGGRPLRVVGIAGSLRRASYNAAALRAAIALAPEGMAIEPAAIGEVPLYNDDLKQQGFPPAVADLRGRIAAADAVLLVTPEYNYSIPGVLKNAIDWASRPPDQPFNGKPVAIMSASTGLLGGSRVQYHLRQSLVFLNAHPLNRPEVMITRAAEKFDAEGNLTDAATLGFVRDLLVALAAWTRRLAPAP